MTAAIDARTGYSALLNDGNDSVLFDNNGLKIESYPDGGITQAKLAQDATSIGVGQTWQAVTRVSGTTYYNTTGKPIMLVVSLDISSGVSIAVGGVTIADLILTDAANRNLSTIIIPDTLSYVITINSGSARAITELR